MKIATAEIDSDEHPQNISKYHLHQLFMLVTLMCGFHISEK